MDRDPLNDFFRELEGQSLVTESFNNANNVVLGKDDEDFINNIFNDDNPIGGADFNDAFAMKQPIPKELMAVDHSLVEYAPFRKKFYRETSEIQKMTVEEVREMRFQLDQIKVRGINCPKPVKNWTQCGLTLPILDVIKMCGFEKPTPIQAQAIPAIMSGRDLIGIAKTGSGKTCAFLIPMIRHAMDQRACHPGEGPIALIMSPTRELAMQTYSECRKFTSKCNLKIVCAYGGVPIKDQISDIKRLSPEIIICTPGRIIDLLVANSGKVTNLSRVTYLVLDEADRMFDLGFGPQVVRIIENIRPDKQAVLFSATFPRQMEALARRVLIKPVEIIVGQHSAVCSDVEQVIMILNDDDEKFIRLLKVLGDWLEVKTQKVLIFVERQDSADYLLRDLCKRGYPCISLHGGKEQMDRDAAILDFKSGVASIMVATSIAARGLDVPNLGLVINYDCPNHMEDYIHRAGRTGRAGNKGTAITFITISQDKYAGDIIRALKSSKVPIPPELQRLFDLFEEKLKKGSTPHSRSGFGGKGLEHIDKERQQYQQTQRAVFEQPSGEEIEPQPTKAERTAEIQSPDVNVITSVISPKPPPRPDLPPNVASQYKQAKAIAESVELAIANKLQVSQFPRYDPIAALNLKHRPSTNQAFGEIIPVYDPKTIGVGLSPEDTIAEPRAYVCEIEINEYPQPARMRVTHRDTISGIIDSAGGQGITVVVKGQYLPANRPIKEGERKLYIRIEGDSHHSVETARSEIRRILMEATEYSYKASS
jgi:ATP-dependent RNA helicase DDX46/PRP5